MGTSNIIDREVIEYLISLLGTSGEQDLNIQDLQREYPLQKEQSLQAAYYIKEFVDRMPGGFFAYHADGQEEIIYANQAMLRMFGCETMEEFRELTGNSFRGIVHPEDLEAVEASIWEQIADSSYDLDYVEYRIITKQGQIRWIDDYGHFVHSEIAGDIFYVYAGDATEKKLHQQMEQEVLQEQRVRKEKELENQIQQYDQEMQMIHQEQLRRIEVIEGLSVDYESAFYVDLDKDLIKAYRMSERIRDAFSEEQQIRFTGFDAEYIQKWVYPDDRRLLEGVTNPEYIRAKLSKEKSFYLSYRIYRNGKPAYIQMQAVNVGSQEHIAQVVLGYRNIDKEIAREMEQKQALVNALEEAVKANNAKNFFLSNMSHDILTPMNAIVSFTALARKHLADREKLAEYLDMISDSSDQLLQLLNDVLEISRIESGNMRVEGGECNLTDLIQKLQKTIHPRAKAKNITFLTEVSGLRHEMVCSDREKLEQLLSCLLDNGIKYTRPGGWVRLTIAEQEASSNGYSVFRFQVEDNGIGIREDFQKDLFIPFEREKNTTLSGVHGTGLGLTIVKSLVDILGGTIEVNSTVGQGSTFTVSFSLQVVDTNPVRREEEEVIQVPFSKPRRILIVDDNELNREIEYEILKDEGFLVDTAEDGSIAVEKIKQSMPGDYDLILMDIQMPVMDGYHATREIRSIDNEKLAGIPIIAVSANTFEEDKRMALDSGMNEHLGKPLDIQRLLEVIQKHLPNEK